MSLQPSKGKIMRSVLAITMAFLAGSVSPQLAKAVTFTYEGDPYLAVFNAFDDPAILPYSASMRMRIMLEIPTPLTTSLGFQFLKDIVTTYSFSDAVQTLDQTNSVLDMLTLRFDASGNIAEWQMTALTPDPANLTIIGRSMSSTGSPDFLGRDLSTTGRCQRLGANGLCEEALISSAFTTGTQNEWTRQPVAPVPVPLPASAWLLAAGAIGLFALSWLKRLAAADLT